MDAHVGSWVKIHGLVARSDLNGKVGVILNCTGDKEAKALAAAGRCKVKMLGTGEVVSIKPSNFSPDDEQHSASSSSSIDWTVLDKPAHVGIDDIVLKSPLGKLDRCDEFVSKLQHALSDGQFMPTQCFDTQMAQQIVAHADKLHAIYFIGCDVVGHELVLEAQKGRARVFQSYIKDEVTIGPVTPYTRPDDVSSSIVKVGYTAAEWAASTPVPGWSVETKTAHTRWGGCKELTITELREFLSLWVEVQKAGKELVKALLKRLPEKVQAAQRKFESGMQHGQETDGSPVAQLARDIKHNISTVSTTYGPKGSVIFSNGSYIGEPFSITIPAEEDARFSKAFTSLTGVAPNSATYFALLTFVDWERAGAMNAMGQVEPIGWTVQAFSVPH